MTRSQGANQATIPKLKGQANAEEGPLKDIPRNRRDPEETSNWSDTTCSETQTYSDSNTIIYSYHGSEIDDNEGEADSPSRPAIMSVLQLEDRNNFACSEGDQDVENTSSSTARDGSADKSNSKRDSDENQVITHMTEEQFQQFLKFGSRPRGAGNAFQKRKKKTSIVKKYFQLPHPCAAYDGLSSFMDGRPLLLNSQESILREELASYGRTEDCRMLRAECNLCADKLKYCPRSLTDDLLMHLMLVHKVKGSKVYISKEDEDQMTRLFNNPSYSSVVWNYFILRRNNTMTECMLCGEVLHYPLDMSTASMRTHLTNEHSVILSHAQWDD